MTPVQPGRQAPSPRPLPSLPFEIIRRILRHRLSLSASYPSSPAAEGEDAECALQWEGMGGQLGRRAAQVRRKEREEVVKAGMGLMRVCKAWKPVVLRYIYLEPPLSPSSTLLLANAVKTGESKWDDTRLHPHSVPSRYIQTLDLSTLSSADGYFGPHITALSRACGVLLGLTPNLTHLRLPGTGIISLSTLKYAGLRHLRTLEGLQIGQEGSEREIIDLLGNMRKLEVVAIQGPGSSITPSADPIDPTPSIDLPHLHTLTIDGIHHGPLLECLINSTFPSLRRVLITSYNEVPLDQTTEFLGIHGLKLRSLTFLPNREWPAIHPTPPIDILDLCPNLLYLGILIPDPALQKKLDFARNLAGGGHRDHPLESVSVPRWIDRVRASPSPSPAPSHAISGLTHTSPYPARAPGGNRFLSCLLDAPPPNLKRIRIDGFTWVSPKLGRAATEAGAGGETRIWANYLAKRGLKLVDGEGREMPDVQVGLGGDMEGVMERGRRRGSRGWGGWAGGGGTEGDEDGG